MDQEKTVVPDLSQQRLASRLAQNRKRWVSAVGGRALRPSLCLRPRPRNLTCPAWSLELLVMEYLRRGTSSRVGAKLEIRGFREKSEGRNGEIMQKSWKMREKLGKKLVG